MRYTIIAVLVGSVFVLSATGEAKSKWAKRATLAKTTSYATTTEKLGGLTLAQVIKKIKQGLKLKPPTLRPKDFHETPLAGKNYGRQRFLTCPRGWLVTSIVAYEQNGIRALKLRCSKTGAEK